MPNFMWSQKMSIAMFLLVNYYQSSSGDEIEMLIVLFYC